MQPAASAFQELYGAFHDRILRYLTRLVGADDAEDLTQEVFLRASRGISDFRGEAQLSTWLYRIATNAAIDKMRSKAASQADAAEELDEETSDASCLGESPLLPDEQVMLNEMYDCFGSYLETIPSAYRTVFVLSDLEDLPNREIAIILGLSLDTVKIRLHRGRTMLLNQLREHCKPEDWL